MEKSGQNPSFGQGLELASIINKAIASAIKKTKADSDKVQSLIDSVIDNPEVISKFFEDLLVEKAETESSILRLISGGGELMIEALDGKSYISENEKLFRSCIDHDFENFGLNNPGLATSETSLNVYEMVKDADYIQVFTSLNSDLDNLVMSQNQIVRFCEKYPTWLRQEEYATFFLIKENDEYFVVRVYVYPNGLHVNVHHFNNDHVWDAENSRRIVCPQLIALHS